MNLSHYGEIVEIELQSGIPEMSMDVPYRFLPVKGDHRTGLSVAE